MRGNEQRQGGWIASFVVVGALLTLGLLGGVYYMKSRAQQASAGEQPVATQNKPADEKKDESKPSDGEDETKQSPATSTDEKSDDETSNGDEETTSVPTTGVATLPQTGPDSVTLQAASLAAVVFAAVVYVQSRRV